MKRTISLIIAIAVMVSMFIVPVSAANVTDVAAIVPGESVLQADISGSKTFSTGTFVIDLNGHEWAGNLTINGDANVTIKDTSAEKTGKITVPTTLGNDAIDISGNPVIVLDGITVVGTIGSGDALYINGSANVTVKKCILTAGKVGVDVVSASATVVVEDTTFADYAEFDPEQRKDEQGRNGAIELRDNAKVTLKGNNIFSVNTIIARTGHANAIKDSFEYGDNASATFGDVYTIINANPSYTAATITYTYTAPATPTEEPTTAPTTEPTVEPTTAPTSEPTVEPTTAPTSEPTTEPTVEPTAEPTNEITVPVEDVEFDMAELGGTADFAPHGYGDKIGLMLGYENCVSLGKYDLSKYSKIIITYATHHPYLNKYDGMPCNSMFAICTNGTYVGYAGIDKRAEAGILAQQDTTDSTGMWVNGERTCEIDLTNVDYNGDIFLSHYNSTGMEPLVTGIVLVAAEGATTVVPGGSTDSTPSTPNQGTNNNNNADTGDFMSLVIVVAAAAFVVTVVSKKRAF